MNKSIFSYFLLFLCVSTVTCVDQELVNIPELVEQVTQKYAGDDFAKQQDALVEKYSSDEFIESVLHPDKKRIDALKKFNEQLLFEFPVQETFGPYAPRVGVYNQDLVSLGFGGVDFGIELFLYKQCREFFVDHVTTCVKNSGPEFFEILKEKNQDVVTKRIQNLCALQTKDLFGKRLAGILTKHLLLGYLVKAVRHRWMFQEQFQGFELFKLLLKDDAEDKDDKPLALFSLVNVDWIFNASTDDGLTAVLAWFNKCLVHYNLVPQFVLNNSVQLVRNATLHMLFFMWFNHYILADLLARYLCEHASELQALSERGPDERELELQDHIERGLNMSYGVWNVFRRKKLAEWNTYYHAIVMIPGVYKIATWGLTLCRAQAKKAHSS